MDKKINEILYLPRIELRREFIPLYRVFHRISDLNCLRAMVHHDNPIVEVIDNAIKSIPKSEYTQFEEFNSQIEKEIS